MTPARWWGVAAVLLLAFASALLLLRPPDSAAAVGDTLQQEWEHTVETFYAVRDLPSHLLTDQPTCEPVPAVAGAEPPTVKLMEHVATPNMVVVTMNHTSCAWIDFNKKHGRDTHFVWEVPDPLVHEGPHWVSEHIWSSHTQTIPYTLTAVGPGGVTVVKGEHTFVRGD